MLESFSARICTDLTTHHPKNQPYQKAMSPYTYTIVTRPITRKDYERDLAEMQRKHLENIARQDDANWRPCMHDQCPECLGTGVKQNGSACIHMISCPCPKCSFH